MSTTTEQGSTMQQRPNILWISTHDINPHIGAYAGVYPGAEAAVTPNLDRLAAEGVRFDNAFATAPVCAPARSSIITGQFPTSIGTMHMRTKAVPPPEVRLLPEYFRQAGYYVTNNWFTDFQMATPPTAFDDCSPTAHWRNRDDPDQPFFATFQGMTTHESQIYLDDDDFVARTAHVPDSARHDPATVALPPYHPDTDVFRTAWARYHDLITEMDHEVGELLQQLEDDGLADNTIVVFWSDHGLGMPRAKRWANEAGLHEPLIIRWPGVLDAGTTVQDVVHVMDIAPTMLTACGVPIPDHMQATSLITPDRALVEQPNEYVFGGRDRMDEQEDTSRTVRDRQYRYIRHMHPDRSPMQHCDYPDKLATWSELRRLAFGEANQLARGERRDLMTDLQRKILAATKPAEELYDIVSDPHEEHDLASDPAMLGLLERMRKALDDWTRAYGDLGQIPEPDLIDQWRPDGRLRQTAAPELTNAADGVVKHSDTPGALTAWTTDAPSSAQPQQPMSAVDGSPSSGRRWKILAAGERVPTDRTIWIGAWRIGYAPSAEIVMQPRAAAPLATSR